MSGAPILIGREIQKSFRRETGEIVHALDGVSFEAEPASLTALVGPDGAGKTTLIRLAAGLMRADKGRLEVLGLDVNSDPQRVQDRIGYMPQKFGLYEDLTVRENLDLYAGLHGVSLREREQKYSQLMEMTNLEPFMNRLAGRLSGGMKQKLGLACTLIRSPELLLLDEPTVGVDPLSRRELWEIIYQLVEQMGLTVLLSTSYMDEAERCNRVIVLHEGKVLAQGGPGSVAELANGRTFIVNTAPGQAAHSLQARLIDHPGVTDALPESGHVRVVLTAEAVAKGMNEGPLKDLEAAPAKANFENGLMVLLQRDTSQRHVTAAIKLQHPPPQASDGEDVVKVRDLVRRFGNFTAVDHVNFGVRRGEIFGLLGPNGAGKTTTFRMLCGLLAPTGGTLEVAGVDVRHAAASARQRLGYVAQKFSLYGQLSVNENLDFFAGAYGLRGARKRERTAWALKQFELTALARIPSGQLPDGQKKRLVMAAAMLHEPEILFLDEPTSGADPLARREFWRRITALAEQGVTVIVTTHFMEEAEYCDRVVVMDAGRVLAHGAPFEIRNLGKTESRREPTMEDAFIAIVEKARSHSQSMGGAA